MADRGEKLWLLEHFLAWLRAVCSVPVALRFLQQWSGDGVLLGAAGNSLYPQWPEGAVGSV